MMLDMNTVPFDGISPSMMDFYLFYIIGNVTEGVRTQKGGQEQPELPPGPNRVRNNGWEISLL